jgi:GR25 family glycosyltransferase involved in LPS biosynthesis
MEGIEKIVYINLDRRPDRREEIEGELHRAGLLGERFSAICTSPGSIGCAQSHLAVLKEARARGYRNILVLEDDFTFLVSKEECSRLVGQALQEVPTFDVLMFAYAINSCTPFSATLTKVQDGQTCAGYLVNQKFYDTLISTWEQSTAKLIRTGEHWNYACDHAWKTLQPGAEWYAFTMRIGKQRASFADTGMSPKWAEYTNC